MFWEYSPLPRRETLATPLAVYLVRSLLILTSYFSSHISRVGLRFVLDWTLTKKTKKMAAKNSVNQKKISAILFVSVTSASNGKR